MIAFGTWASVRVFVLKQRWIWPTNLKILFRDLDLMNKILFEFLYIGYD